MSDGMMTTMMTMEENVGLEYIVGNPDYCAKLAAGLDASCPGVRKDVLELLSALSCYSPEGRQRVLDTLELHRARTGARYRLGFLVRALTGEPEDSGREYKAAVLAFVNCLIGTEPVLKERVRLRNEFVGLKLLPALNELRREKSQCPGLRVQLEAFDELRETDEELADQGPPGIDLSSHVDVFYAILGQIADTPQEIAFLSVLQHLLRLDPKEPASDLAWDTAETLVHRATLLENREDATKLLRSPSLQTNACCHCRGVEGCAPGSGTRKGSAPGVPPPPPPPPAFNLPPPPPPPPMMMVAHQVAVVPPAPAPPGTTMLSQVGSTPATTGSFSATAASAGTGAPPPPPPSSGMMLQVPQQQQQEIRAPSPEPMTDNSARLLPQQEIPAPRAKMKTINWNKIPNNKVIGKNNIWSIVASEHRESPAADLDWDEMEGLFCQQVLNSAAIGSTARYGAQGLGSATGEAGAEGNSQGSQRQRQNSRQSTEITLLDGKRSLNVSIFLKQFRTSNEDIIQLIREGAHDDIGAEKLRGLLKILPEVDELEMLKGFDGDKTRLGNAEKFFLQLIQVPNYKLRIEAMLLKEEFAANMGYIESSVHSMILAGEDLMTNKPLQEVLYMIVVAGNFLNSGGYAGNAAGVKMSSLQKLTEIRANKPGMNLIHYVALQAERKRKDLLNLVPGMETLDAATKTTVEQLTNEFNALDTRIQKLKSQIQLPSTEEEIQQQMGRFLQIAEEDMNELRRDLVELDNLRRTLADFFCEDSNTFKIEECFRVFHQFCQKFQQAVAENERRRVQEEQVNARRKQREEQLMAKKRLLSNQPEISDYYAMDCSPIEPKIGQKSYGRDAKVKRLQSGLPTSDEENSNLGSPSLRRRFGLGSAGPDSQHQQQTKEDNTYSPDITPNGTLRRRRSRIPCEDDEGNLMDFLRTTGQDISRERKSWGSLDRSWAKRARGQPRRSELLNADFSGDRERPNSPSPLVENKSILQQVEPKPTGKAWRQKIEAWLTENEKEERAGEDLQRRTRERQSFRRPHEDSENESKHSQSSPMGEPQESPSSNKYQKYNWQPSVEKTDVFRTMEAIEESQPVPTQKDKSVWRKSSLNVLNSPEESDRYSRRYRSRLMPDNKLGSSTLQAIREEKRKENKVSEPTLDDGPDELTIYIRQPTTTSTASVPASRRLSQLSKRGSVDSQDSPKQDKIEIDSDNIETPPVTRKLFSPPKEINGVAEKEQSDKRDRIGNNLIEKENDTDIYELGSGNFDRFSAARRTRRYKKNLDPERIVEKEPVTKDSEPKEPESIQNPRRPSTLSITSDLSDNSRDPMLPVWQEKLKRRESQKESLPKPITEELSRSASVRSPGSVTRGNQQPVLAVTNTVLSPVMQESRLRDQTFVQPERATSSRERRRSMIDPSQVKESRGLFSGSERLATSPIAERTDERLRDEQRNHEKLSSSRASQNEKNLELSGSRCLPGRNNATSASFRTGTRYIPDLALTTTTTSTPTAKSASSARDQEFNDEGFEETQSLVSESLSQEASSGNYETDNTHDSSTRCSPAELVRRVVPDESPIAPATQASVPKKKSAQNPLQRRESTRSLTGRIRATLVEAPKPKTAKPVPVREMIGKREPVLPKKSLVEATKKKEVVERSGSRSSLRSSRSSLNSSTSINTVKNNGAQLGRYSSAIRALAGDLKRSGTSATTTTSSAGTAETAGEKRGTVNGKATTALARIPASRSSSSGSSIGPIARRNQKSGTGSNPPEVTRSPSNGNLRQRSSTTNSRSGSNASQNQPATGPNPNSSSSLRPKSVDPKSASLVNAAKNRLAQAASRTPTRPSTQSFMRPTAASVNKNSIANFSKNLKPAALVK